MHLFHRLQLRGFPGHQRTEVAVAISGRPYATGSMLVRVDELISKMVWTLFPSLYLTSDRIDYSNNFLTHPLP